MVGIIILSYNNNRRTLECIESVKRFCKGGNWKICVVDNASKEEDYNELRSRYDGLILRTDVNCGYACGNNLGLEHFDKDSEVDSILILNNDTLMTEDIVTPMEAYLASHSSCGVVFPLVLTPQGTVDMACMRHSKTTRDLVLQATGVGKFGVKRPEFIEESQLRGADGKWNTDSEGAIFTDVPPGSCMMLKKDVFRSIGWLDPHTFLYFEEHILSDKLKAKGLKSVLLPDISIIHLGAATTRTQTSKEIYRHWRNSYLYYMRNFSSVPRGVQAYLRFRTWLKTLL